MRPSKFPRQLETPLRLSALFILVMVLTCCGTHSAASNNDARSNASDTPQQVLQGLAELDQLIAPDGSDPHLFAELKAILAAQLKEIVNSKPSDAPSSEASQVTNLIAYQTTEGSMRLAWTYRNQGDYDQNSEVSAQDLITIGQHYGLTPDYPFWNVSLLADGDSNGEVNSSDIVPIAQYFNNRLDQYIIQSSLDGKSDWIDVDSIPFSESSLDEQGGPRRFTYETTANAGTHWRVVPLEAEQPGITSIPIVYKGEPIPTYNASGFIFDSHGIPLSDIQIEIEDVSYPTEESALLLSGADGKYEFKSVDDGTTATLTPIHPGLVFIPRQRGLTIDGNNVDTLDFKGFTVTSLQTSIPTQALSLTDIPIQIQALDADNLPLTGFNTEATLSSEPAGMQLSGKAKFVNGVAQVNVRFPNAGDFVISISGLDITLDGNIGAVHISDPVMPELSIPTWGNDADAAISLTFDDGTPDHWQRGMPMWEEYGFKVTLGIISSTFPEERKPQLNEAFQAGHELANHTNTHPDMATLTSEQQRQELQVCSDFITSNVQKLDYIPTVIYPYESFSETVMETLQSMGYMYARSGYQGIVDYAELNNPWDPPLLHLYSWANLNTLPVSMWNDTTDWAVTQGGWLIEQCHGIGTEGEPGVGWNPRPELEYREHYDHIASYGDRIWVAPIGTVGTYLIERNCAQLNILESSNGHLEFEVVTGLVLPMDLIPLTIRLTKPEGWNSIYVRQNGVPLKTDVYTKGEMEYFRFDVTPDSGDITVTRY